MVILRCMEKHLCSPVMKAWVSLLASDLLTRMILWASYFFSFSLYFLIGSSGISTGTPLDDLSTNYYNKVFKMLLNTQNISQKTNKQSMLIAFPSYFSCSSSLAILLHKMKLYFIFIRLTILLGAYWTR